MRKYNNRANLLTMTKRIFFPPNLYHFCRYFENHFSGKDGYCPIIKSSLTWMLNYCLPSLYKALTKRTQLPLILPFRETCDFSFSIYRQSAERKHFRRSSGENLWLVYKTAGGTMLIQRTEFKTWTRLFAFHVALILTGTVWIELFSL